MATRRKRPVKRKTTHCKRCCNRRSFEGSMMGTISTGAKVVVAAGMLGAIGHAMHDMNE